MNKKIIDFKDLSKIRNNIGKRVVQCHGVFDLLHFGHLNYLTSAKQFGDILVVTVTKDKFVNKGPNRPLYNETQRVEMIASLELVDYVSISPGPLAIEAINELKPDYYVKGPDYKNKNDDITGNILLEEKEVIKNGGKLVFTDDETKSSTTIINKYFNNWSKEQKKYINMVRNAHSVNSIIEYIDKVSELGVLTIGEPIVDSYVFCQPENISSKSPTISAKYINEEKYPGGAIAIGRHAAELGCPTTLQFTHGGEEYFHQIIDTVENEFSINFDCIEINGMPTPEKTRYIALAQSQRIFELINVNCSIWGNFQSDVFIDKLKSNAKKNDIIIVADFGHGLFEAEVLKALSSLDTFIALNVQTNSENYGYNFFHKHSRFDYISIDERECRLGMHDRSTPIFELAEKAYKEKIKKPMTITLGTKGSMFFNENGEIFSCPTFFKNAVDTTGAGDAYFVMSSLLVKLGAPDNLIPFIGNIYAGLKTQIIGNKYPVKKIDLIKSIKSILG